MDFEMNMPSSKGKRESFKAEIIAIGAIKYDTKTGKIDKFKSLIKPITNQEVFPHIEELTHITTEDLETAPTYEKVMREFKLWLGMFSEIEGIYTFGNLDLTCFNYTDRLSSQKNNHPRFLNNIRDLFVDIKNKYVNLGIKCMNYVSLKNLLEYANVKCSGDAHDPLYDAYNLYILDKVLEEKKLNLTKINIEEDDADMSVKYNVRNIPTVIVVDDNDVEVKRFTGTKTEVDLREFFDELS